MDNLSIKNWSIDDRPREKLIKNGRQSLSNAELMAILIGSGNRTQSAVELSKQILHQFDNDLNKLSKCTIKDLVQIKGIGEAKAVSIIAAIELGLRRKNTDSTIRKAISSSQDVFELMQAKLMDLPYEEFWVIYLNRSNKVIEKIKFSQGGISGTVVDIRLILKSAIQLLASSIILVHNHPSGQTKPSQQDLQLTKKLKEAALLFDIQVLDHLVISDKHFFSFADEGEL
jgi:DNA repair protein RadC